jgi:hypothetical protein
MPENDEAATAETTTDNENTEDSEATTSTAEGESDESFREKWENQRKVNRDLEAKLKDPIKVARKQLETEYEQRLQQALKDREGKTEAEQEAEKARREVEDAALAKANQRIVRAELKAAAATKVKRPDLLIKVTDLSAIPVDENGDPDAGALDDAIATFLEDYPELAADAAKFSGSADQGSKGKQSKPGQLTREDLAKLTPEQINEARAAGRLKSLGY